MKTLLVATDFSSAATHAAKYAAEMALAIDADISLLYVYQVPVSYTEVPEIINITDFIEDAEAEMSILKKELSLIVHDNIDISSSVVTGVFFQELKQRCEEIQPYAVIMGSQGTTAAERLIFGDHTIYAMRHLTWPLITVPKSARISSIKKIGLACDLENIEHSIPVDEIIMMVSDFGAELHILNTGKKDIFNPDAVFESGVLEHKFLSLHPVHHFIDNSNTDEGIMDFVEKNLIDLLIVIPKHPGLLNMIIHKSHTKQFILHCHVPVMAIHH